MHVAFTQNIIFVAKKLLLHNRQRGPNFHFSSCSSQREQQVLGAPESQSQSVRGRIPTQGLTVHASVSSMCSMCLGTQRLRA